MKNIIIVCDHAFINGGQAKVAIETALYLRAVGRNVTVFCGVGPPDARLGKAGVETVCLGQDDLLGDPNRLRSAVRGLWNREAASALRQLLAQFNPADTIVHVHGWAKSLSPSIGPVVTSSAIPHVYTMHEYFLACPNGGFYDYRTQTICTRRPLGADCLTTDCDPRSRAHKAWRVARQAVLWTAGTMPHKLHDVIYLSETQLLALRGHLSKATRFHHLPNPVATNKTNRVAAEENDLFLFVGRLSAEKGAEVAAHAARSAGVNIAFAGEGECRGQILAANPQAKMLGWLKPDELAAWVEKARCLVFPSLWYECLPLSVIEAMQRGVPVLASDRSAGAELIRHDLDGLHVVTGDVESWGRAMMLMCEPIRTARYSRSAFEAAKSFLDERSYAPALLAIYEKAAAAQQSLRVPA